jgi:hypothetical protein
MNFITVSPFLHIALALLRIHLRQLHLRPNLNCPCSAAAILPSGTSTAHNDFGLANSGALHLFSFSQLLLEK